jgi:ABC-type phosphate transport system permease subunit
MRTEGRYKDFVGGCVLVALLGNHDRLLFWGTSTVLLIVVLLLIFGTAALARR